MTDPFTLDARLCDDNGMVSHEPTPPNVFAPGLTYIGQLNNLRAQGGEKPYSGDPFTCTGHAHLAGHHIRCTSPAHLPKGAAKVGASATSATQDLARRLSAHPAFAWAPGMRLHDSRFYVVNVLSSGVLVIANDLNLGELQRSLDGWEWRSGSEDWHPCPLDGLPDLDDPATCGALVGILDARGICTEIAGPITMLDNAFRCRRVYPNGAHLIDLGPTRGHAIASALLAVLDAGEGGK